MANDAGSEAKSIAGAITSMKIEELISGLAIGIANGQMQLDKVCMDIATFMGQAQIDMGKKPGTNLPDQISLIELGFTPNFYQFVDTILEVKVAISSKLEEKREVDTSITDIQSKEHQDQQQYQQANSSNSSGSSYGYGYGGGYSVGWGWNGYGVGWGGSGWGSNNSYANASSSSMQSSASNKQNSLTAVAVDAKYASTYNYSVEAASTIKTKIVPVPPPEVFEQIIRSKVQERRDWENLMQLLFTVAAITSELKNKIRLINDGYETFPVGLKKMISDLYMLKQSDITELKNQLASLNETYQRITTSHWASMRGSVSLREQCDVLITGATADATKLVNGYDAEGNFNDHEIDSAAVLKKIADDLIVKFSGKVDEIRKMLPPESINV